MFRTSYDKKTKQWSGPQTQPIFNLQTSVGNVILYMLDLNGSKVAQICANTNKCTTFEELRVLTIRAANNFKKLGFKKGDVLYFMTNNSADIAPLVFAALCLGCPMTAQPISSSKAECLYFLNVVKPSFVFCDLEFCGTLNECLKNLKNDAKLFTFDGQTDESTPVDNLFDGVNDDANFIPTEVDAMNDTAFIMQSSGTTGMQKGIRISHAILLEKPSPMKSTDVSLVFSNLDATTYVKTLIFSTLNGSSRIVNQGLFSPQRFFELVERCKVTYILTAPYTIIRLLNDPQIETANFSSVRLFVGAGSKLSFDLIEKANKYFGGILRSGYGMTEVGGFISLNMDHMRNGCVGQLIVRCDAKILNEHGDRLGVNEDGELHVKQPCQFLGYLGDNQSASSYVDSEGFYATGDIARFDDNGDLFIVDRKKELFKSCAEHVTPSEIEEFLNKIDGVKISCVVPIPDPKGDNLPAAVIVKADNSICTEEVIYNSVASNFAPWKHLRGGVYFVDSLPITSTAKVARRLVTQMANELFNAKQ